MMQRITAHDPEAKSPDVAAENVARLKALFPELITEGPDGVAVNVDVLKALVGDRTVTDAEEKYGLTWHGKRAARRLALTPSTGTLRPCPEDSVDWETTQNLMIDGDNLEVLKLLQKSYAGKVKLIYIDPPYNTGKDFVYPDSFQDNIRNYLELTGQAEGGRKITSNTEASGRFHTDWLNMMYPRLELARSLLTHDGLVFVNIDDMEVHSLRHAMNDVFGEENFIANVVWQKKYTRANDARFFSDNHDHILVFARNGEYAKILPQPRSDDQKAAYSNPDNHPKGLWKATPLHAKSGTDTSPYSFTNGVRWSPPPGTFRRFSDQTMARMETGNEIWFGSDGRSTPTRKSFLSEVKQGVTPVTIWTHDEVGHNHEANSEVKTLVGGGVFDNPKPTRLLRRVIQIGTVPDDSEIVLDFFAGSGSTAHAVMAQNAADGGNRRYILVQLPEPLDPENKDQRTAAAFCKKLGKPLNIAELTKERLRRAADRIREESPLFAGDLGFRVFKLDSTNIREWEPQPEDLETELQTSVEHLKADRMEADILYELLLKLGLDLCVPIETKEVAHEGTNGTRKDNAGDVRGFASSCEPFTVYSIGGGVLMACLSEDIGREDVETLGRAIVAWRRELAPAGDTTCVFRDSAFADDVAKTNLAAILEQNGIANVRSL